MLCRCGSPHRLPIPVRCFSTLLYSHIAFISTLCSSCVDAVQDRLPCICSQAQMLKSLWNL